ncbi:MAG: glycoside hydrolase, partial [Methylococcales bacterium]|nr:glycoside hydrolase [Methylococcales bacterium]
MPDEQMDVVLCWHMHQPNYWDRERNEYRLPWTYLHGIKDYVDMAAHIENCPNAKAVVNFTPTLLEQIDDYSQQVNVHLSHGLPIKDPMLRALTSPVMPCESAERVKLVHACMKANENRMINRFPAYRRLADIVNYFSESENDFAYLGGQFIVDLLMWYHITWMGEVVRLGDTRIQSLIEKGREFTFSDRKLLVGVVAELLASIIPRYKALAEQGRVELSVTPYAHPIAPILLDVHSTKDAMPDAPLPDMAEYPGGESRMLWHIEEGLRVFKHYFGFEPKGCWPAEGAVSAATAEQLDQVGFAWMASGQTVLHNSLVSGGHEDHLPHHWLHQSYQMGGQNIRQFFRDDGLSDLIGFHYADWHADDAVSNMVNHIENIQISCENPERQIVSIVLDGENAWEYYPDNGIHFLSGLYEKLVASDKLNLTTFDEHLAKQETNVGDLTSMVAGSWVYGTFSTWIGDHDKNRGWEMLRDVKLAFDEAASENTLPAERFAEASKQLAVCEGSDWFWWFGDYNSAQSVSDFECLFRI